MADEAGATGKDEKNPPDGEKLEPKKDDPPKWVNDLFTRIGRVDKETKDALKALKGDIEGLRGQRETPPKDKAETDNKDLERILQGDLTVIDERINQREKAKEMLAKQNETALNRIISEMEEAKVPYFAETKKGIRETAATLIVQGYSPQDAVAFAYEKNRADHLHKLVSGNTGPGFDSANLETSGGGSQREDAGAKKGKLNAEGKKAWEKNKAYFKDEAEYIAAMSPLVRQRFVG